MKKWKTNMEEQNCVGERGERKLQKEREDCRQWRWEETGEKGCWFSFLRYCFFSYQLGDDLFLLGYFLCYCVLISPGEL